MTVLSHVNFKFSSESGLKPDPDPEKFENRIRIHAKTPDPDPQHWLLLLNCLEVTKSFEVNRTRLLFFDINELFSFLLQLEPESCM